jgi:hypothetical protein
MIRHSEYIIRVEPCRPAVEHLRHAQSLRKSQPELGCNYEYVGVFELLRPVGVRTAVAIASHSRRMPSPAE